MKIKRIVIIIITILFVFLLNSCKDFGIIRFEQYNYQIEFKSNITLNPIFMPHFEQLYETKAFITMMGTDMVSFDSVYSFHLYQHL